MKARERMNLKSTFFIVLLMLTGCISVKEPKKALNTYFVEDFNFYSNKVGLKPLNYYGVAKDSLLLRIWVDHCLGNYEGYFIRRIYGKWSGEKLVWNSINPELKTLTPVENAMFPNLRTWDEIGNSLLENDILNLRDMHNLPKLNNRPAFFGGCSVIVVELKTHIGYRNYYYNFEAGQKLNDFSESDVVNSFKSAENIRNILLHCFEPKTKLGLEWYKTH
jgi:hypothetical protein